MPAPQVKVVSSSFHADENTSDSVKTESIEPTYSMGIDNLSDCITSSVIQTKEALSKIEEIISRKDFKTVDLLKWNLTEQDRKHQQDNILEEHVSILTSNLFTFGRIAQRSST